MGSGAVDIAGATGVSYTLTLADAHRYVRLKETGADSGTGTPTPRWSVTVATDWQLIGKGDQTVTFGPLPAKTYGDGDFAPGATATSGLAVSYTSSNPNVATIVANNIHITGAGECTITASQPGDGNWNIASDVVQTLKVTKKQLTVTTADKSRLYGDSNPDFTVTYAGFVNGDDAGDLTTQPTVICAANAASPVATYPIIPAPRTSPESTATPTRR